MILQKGHCCPTDGCLNVKNKQSLNFYKHTLGLVFTRPEVLHRGVWAVYR